MSSNTSLTYNQSISVINIIALLPTWSVVTYITANVIILIAGVLGNGVIIVVEIFNKHKTSTDWLVLFMSLNDFIMAAIDTPFYILIYGGAWTTLGSDALCKIGFAIQETMSYSSTLLLSVTAIDRYIKTCRPHSMGITPSRARLICNVITSCVVVIIGLPIVFAKRYDVVKHCSSGNSPGVRLFIKIIVYIVQISFLAMFIIVIICYTKIALTLRKKLNGDLFRAQFKITTLTNSGTEIKQTGKRNQVFPATNKPTTSSTKDKEEESDINCSKLTTTDTVENTNLTTNQQAIDIAKTVVKDSVIKTKPTGKRNEPQPMHKNAILEKRMIRTSVVMFLVTLVFILSWVPVWVVAFMWPLNLGETINENIVIMFGRRFFMVNTCTNPFFYITMSSIFRMKTKLVLKKIYNSCKRRI